MTCASSTLLRKMTIEINLDPMPMLGPVPINWYGITYLLGRGMGFGSGVG